MCPTVDGLFNRKKTEHTTWTPTVLKEHNQFISSSESLSKPKTENEENSINKSHQATQSPKKNHICKLQKSNLPTYLSRGFLGSQHMAQNIPKKRAMISETARGMKADSLTANPFFSVRGARVENSTALQRGPISVNVSSLAFDTCGVEYFYTVFNLFFMT